MIIRVFPPGSSFKGLVSYQETGKGGLQKKWERVDWVEFRNLPTRDTQVAACFMAATAGDSVTGTKTPVYHFSLSWDPDDPVNPDMMRRVADRTIRDMGLQEHEILIFAHKDRSHPHLHFVVNRVHPERFTLWSNWWDYARFERSLRAQEVELGLRIVPGRLARTPRQEMDGPGQEGAEVQRRPRPGPRRGDAAFVADLTKRATPVLARARSWAELERGLAEDGLAVQVKGGGIRLTDGVRQAKASEVDGEFSRRNLEKRFGSFPDYRARMAAASQSVAPSAPTVQLPVPARQQEAPAPPIPTPAEVAVPRPPDPARTARRPQFGDAGHGIAELFGHYQAPEHEQPHAVVEHAAAPEPQPVKRDARFLEEVQERATPVFERVESWAELERGLSDHGLSLRVKGGGFTVTDGRQEVKASDVGRAFSRFHLEKRLGQYQASPAPIPEPATPPAAPEAAVRPQAPEQPPELPAPVQQPAPRAPAQQLPIPFAEAPAVIPARRKVELPTPPQPSLSVADPPAPEPPARRQAEPPASTPPTPPPASRQVEPVTPRAPLQPPPTTPEPAPPPRSPVRRRQRAAPRRMRTHPPTERDKYREVSWSFKHQLAILYRNPRAARRAFDVELGFAGSERALRTLADAPENYGRLRVLAKPEQVAVTVRWAKIYANWQSGSTRPARIVVTDLVGAAALTTAVQKALRDAEVSVPEAVDRCDLLKKWDADADTALVTLRTTATEVYVDRKEAFRAISAHHRTHGREATVTAVQVAPERFGALRPDKHQGALSRLVRGPQTRDARYRAWELGQQVGAAYRALEAKPTPEDLVRAEQAVEDAKRALDAANRRSRELPRVSAADYVREAARVLRYAASESGQSVESIMGQLMPRLPDGAVQQALKVLDEVHRPPVDPGQSAVGWGQSTVSREKPRSPGIDL